MSVIFVMLPVAMALAGVALAAFFWAAHRGQFDDLETPAYRVLFDDPPTQQTVEQGRETTCGIGHSVEREP
jgi:cbb3-type cytochrome oxidase maturation protein